MNKLFKNSTLLIIFRTLTAISLAVVLILISRTFGPEGKGIFTILTIIPLLAFNLGHLGIGNANVYLISKNKGNSEKALFHSLIEGLVIGIFFTGLFLLVYKIYPSLLYGSLNPFYIWLALISIPFIFWERFLQGIFVGKQEFWFFNVATFLNKVLMIIVLILQINFWKSSIQQIALSYTLIMISLPIIFIIYLLSTQKNIFSFDPVFFRATLSFGMRNFLVCTLAFLVIRSDMLIINSLLGLSAVGLYSLAVNFTDEILLVASSIALALFPHINERPDQSLDITLKTTRILSLLLIVILSISSILVKPIVLYFFGRDFVGSLPSFYILAIAIYFLSICTIISQFFSSKNFPWKAIIAWLPGLIINITLNFIFIPKLGIIAAAFSSLFAYTLTFVLYYFLLKKYSKISLGDVFVLKKDDIISLKTLLKKMNKKYE